MPRRKQARPLKPTTIQPRRDRGRPPAQARQNAAAPDAQEVVAQPQVQPTAPASPTAMSTALDDVIAMISASKSQGATAAAAGAADAADAPEAIDATDLIVDEAVETKAAVAQSSTEELPMTPLEQSVHDLIDRLREGSDKAPSHGEVAEPEPIMSGTTILAGVGRRRAEEAQRITGPQARPTRPRPPSRPSTRATSTSSSMTVSGSS